MLDFRAMLPASPNNALQSDGSAFGGAAPEPERYVAPRLIRHDRSFINKMIGSKSDTAVVQAIVAIAKSMDLKVIAEGVETIEQLKFLKEHIYPEVYKSLESDVATADVFQVQGYLINEALPLSRIDKDFQTINDRSEMLLR